MYLSLSLRRDRARSKGCRRRRLVYPSAWSRLHHLDVEGTYAIIAYATDLSASSHSIPLCLSLSLERCLSALCSLFSLSTLERVSSSRGEVRSSEHVALSRERESYRDVLLAVPRSSACSASLISFSTLERQRDWCVQLYHIR